MSADLEEALAALLFDARARAALRAGHAVDPRLAALDVAELEESSASVRRMILERTHRGTGGLRDWFPRTLAGQDLDRLVDRFCSSPECAAWRETPASAEGISLEEALHRFFVAAGIGDDLVREEEFLSATVRALAVTPRAAFAWPTAIRPAPGGCFAITRGLVLHAAIDGRYARGAITPLVASVLGADIAHSASPGEVAEVTAALRQMRLL